MASGPGSRPPRRRGPRIRVGQVVAAVAVISLIVVSVWAMLHERDDASGPLPGLQAVAFSDLPGWEHDDFTPAWAAFTGSCQRLVDVAAAGGDSGVSRSFLRVCRLALTLPTPVSDADARAFFERHFIPYRYGTDEPGFLTGYYNPVLAGSRERTERFDVAVLGRPDDLVMAGEDAMQAADGSPLSAMRRSADGRLVPYYTRAEIEAGALDGRGLELVYLEDAVDAFVMHVQGSATVRLRGGETIRLGYAGKNGHAYTSIGRVLVERGEIAGRELTLERLRDWLRADEARGRLLMQANASYIFFKENRVPVGQGPQGAMGIGLLAGRSLAVDRGLIELGTPVYVSAPGLRHHGSDGFARLMVAHDVGSAIRGVQRGDIYWGSGDEAERLAGETSHSGRFHVLRVAEGATE